MSLVEIFSSNKDTGADEVYSIIFLIGKVVDSFYNYNTIVYNSYLVNKFFMYRLKNDR